MKTYEGMLLVEPTIAAKDWKKVEEEVDRIAKRSGAAIIQLAKWGERKLAHKVLKHNRGAYVLAYLSVPEESVTKLRADLELSEVVLRSLILRHDGELIKDPPKDFATAGPLPPRASRGRFGSPRPGGGRPGGSRPDSRR